MRLSKISFQLSEIQPVFSLKALNPELIAKGSYFSIKTVEVHRLYSPQLN